MSGIQTQFPASVSLASLNGKTGFNILGIGSSGVSANNCGSSVSSAGDVNADGINDLIISAPAFHDVDSAGTSYVIFGAKDIGSSGSFSLPSLNGINGFIISSPSCLGSGVGDVNADGIDDLIMGAPYANNDAGASYVVFGAKNIGSSGSFFLSSLNGSNGFNIAGVSGDQSGYSVGSAGDINTDGINDLIIDAPNPSFFCETLGASYVIFGAKNIGSSGSFLLSNLNGNNGFNIPASALYSPVSSSVSSAGDINADGISDLIIGAPGVNQHTGASYVIFGAKNIGSYDGFQLSNLNGSNGFVINGVSPGDQCGYSVSSAGDINADGINDLIIGAPAADNNVGASYVIFGDGVSFLTSNCLTIRKGETILLNNSFLSATYFNTNNNPSIRFTISNIQHQHGYFSLLSNPLNPINSFLQQQIINGSVQFTHDNSGSAPTFSTQIGDGGLAAMLTPEPANITFIHLGAILIDNQLTINQGQTVTLLSTDLSANDLDSSVNNPTLIFLINNMQHGYFQKLNNPSVSINSFVQSDVGSDTIQFVHDGSVNPPNYTVAVSDGFISSNAQYSHIQFYLAPILVNNTLTINQDETVIFNHKQLAAIDNQAPSENLTFTIQSLQSGQFQFVNTTNKTTTQFTQSQIDNGLIAFTQDGSATAPSYAVILNNGHMTLNPAVSNIIFNALPVLGSHSLSVIQGKSVVLGKSDLSAIDDHTPADDLVFIVSALEHCSFEGANTPVSNFTQGDVDQGYIHFVADGSVFAPTANISVSDGILTTKPIALNIAFSTLAPALLASSNLVRNAIIASSIISAVGFIFLVARFFISYQVNKGLYTALANDQTEAEERLTQFRKEVTLPIVKKIFEKIKTTNIIGYRSEISTKEYIAAVERLVVNLHDLKVELNIETLSVEQQTRLFNEIMRQIKLTFESHNSYCSIAYLNSFFKPTITPQQLEAKADVIARAVWMELKRTVNDVEMKKSNPNFSTEATDLSATRTYKP